ncbi:hypothetical protein BHE74_00040691 [Ensete ventricosum]|nr:hypothetical protein BHE74_00040691 [Ensete ventricosum]
MNRKPGDWTCRSCQHLNFSRRDSCQRCSDSRPSSDRSEYASFGGSRIGGSSFGFSGSDVRPGDWYCSCGAHNFASRSSCFKCCASKEDLAVGGGGGFGGDMPRSRGYGFGGSGGGMESDDEIRRVPDFGFQPAGPSTSGREAASADGPDQAQPGQRRRGRSVADKEHKQLKSDPFVCFWCVPFRKRLLRNRVSAQQARERKKAYLNDLEAMVKDLEGRNSELEERMSTLQNENNMLRQVCLLDISLS